MVDDKRSDAILRQALDSTGIVEVIRSSADEGSIKVLYRVRQKRIWLGILEYVLSRAEGWSAHVCQQYFLRGGKLVYGWNFILQPPAKVVDVAKLLSQASVVVPRTMPAVTGPLESFPLVGSSSRRTASIAFDPRLPGPGKGGPSHKGAYPMSSGE